MPITKTDVEKLAPGTLLWDAGKGSILGFGVRKQRRDAVFVLKYSMKGRQRWYTIGRFGSPWTVELARLEAKKLLGRVASGEDPSGSRDDAKAGGARETMAELCDRYMVAARAGAILTRFNRPKKTSTLDIDVGRIERHIKPLIGSTRVADVDARIVKRMIQDVTVGKTAATIKTKARGRALVTGGAATAARVADLLSGIMTWAVDEGIVVANPVHRVRRYRSEPRQRFLNDSELATLGTRIRAGVDPEDKPFHPYALAIIQLLCLTGCRSSEITNLEWTEVDLEQKCLRLEDTKSGRSLRAIGNNAVELLIAHSRIEGRSFVFPGAKGEIHYQGLNKEAPRVFRSAGLLDVTCHVLRHTFASVASELGYSDGTIAGLLGHKGRGVTSRYIHRPDAALASAAEAVSNDVWRRMEM
ncbi:site-specific integrase [Mesorhizobium sp. B292B1B]|uniref:tyrosine-type recombinase/integrase n=3 Tax=Mesorhizobium TaxID=68287 RepID=UPI001128B7EF|nr:MULTISPECIES: site-specific integrase [unclassified Mesorhizobium]MCA0012908.1 site-specific integrase [Mesorhizobium sp. B294B1A1]MCA0037591.1 site-specific integrase [Mesorhizobium sp. B292B1B]TPM50698.1 site-specific integrase [Mesorhizobium sp. B2-3-2]